MLRLRVPLHYNIIILLVLALYNYNNDRLYLLTLKIPVRFLLKEQSLLV